MRQRPAYTAFAAVYDRWCADVDPARWGRYNVALARRHGFSGGRVLDLGCGTGLSTRPWVGVGDAVLGVDRSPQMLRLARRSVGRRRGVRFLRADITAPGLLRGQTFALVQANFDVINCQTREHRLLRLFRNARRLLAPGGCFLFDVVTAHAYRRLLNGVSVFQRVPGGALVLEGRYREPPGLWQGTVTFLAAGRDGHYRAAEERHRQRHYSPSRLRALLRAAGFSRCHLYATLTFRSPGPGTERLTVVARA
ncbi:MAG: class I SAM-dependent methyltransferase [candidate division NC10 bacterium]|nr:class I SAM-dependent methyltransferase [candidate division NC10 bacterium]